ncbi:MAG: 3-oxoacyl-ACP reductase [Myxococcota bacterium]
MNDTTRLLEGKVALVTGASQGIGAAIAQRLSAHGATVGVNYFQSKREAEALAASLRELGGSAEALGADVRDRDQVHSMVGALEEKFGGVDVVVNNALHDYRFDPTSNPRFEDMDWSQFQAQIDGTVAGATHVIQAALPSMRSRGGGSVVNILTNLISNPVVQYHAYTTAKSAMLGFSRNLAAELGPDGIRVNMIAGGLIMTTRASAPTTEDVQNLVRSITPLRRLGAPDDIADVVVGFASDLNRFVTGQMIAVDGGLTMP